MSICLYAVSGGMSRTVTWDIVDLGENVKWFMQYSGFGETTVLSLYTKTEIDTTWRRYMKVKHVLDLQADGKRVLIMCKSSERKKDFKVAGYVDSFAYEDVNEELNHEGENIRSTNGDFLTYCIIYGETNTHTKTQEERAFMIEQDYKAALRRVQVIVEEAKASRLEALSKKKQIREGKRKAGDEVREAAARKKARQDDVLDLTVQDNPEEDENQRKGKKKPSDPSPFLEVEKIPKKSKSGPPDKSVGDRLMDLEVFMKKYSRVFIFGEGVSGYVNIANVERGDAGYNCRPISEAHLREMKTWLFNFAFMQKNHPNFLTIVPADRSSKPGSFEEVEDKRFHVVNGQHTLAACLEFVNDPESTPEVKNFFSRWPCNVVWAPEGDDDPLFHLSGVLNLDSEYRKHYPTWVECIQHARKTWIRRGKPPRTNRESATNSEAFRKWKEFTTCLMWTFRVEKESNLIMEHIFPTLGDELWRKWERIFMDFERGEYIDTKTLALAKEKKGFKPKSVVKNDMKHTRGLTEVELDMAADQCLVTREGEEYPRHTLKTIGEWAYNRKKKNETYIAMAECLDPPHGMLFKLIRRTLLTATNGMRGRRRTILDGCRGKDYWTCWERIT